MADGAVAGLTCSPRTSVKPARGASLDLFDPNELNHPSVSRSETVGAVVAHQAAPGGWYLLEFQYTSISM
jgi:hypothetical protein